MEQSTELLLSRIVKPLYGGMGHILMFHRICPETEMISAPGLSRIEISPAQFEMILDFFSDRGFRFLSLDEVLNALLNHEKTRFVSLTFDDGYLDNLEIAYPILKERHIPFAIYITNSFPDRTAILWQYLLDDVIKQKKPIRFTWLGKDYRFEFQEQSQLPASVAVIRELIKDTSPNQVTSLCETIFSPVVRDLHAATREKTLDWDQVKTLAQDPLVTIGGHTQNHQPLVRLDFEEAHQDIVQSKYVLEQQIGKKAFHFAYPFGEVSPREVELVYRSGYLTAVTTRLGNIFRGHSHHLLTLPRLNGVEMTDDAQIEILTNGLTAMKRNRFRQVSG